MKTINLTEIEKTRLSYLAEAFKAGQAVTVVEKLGGILSRKIGKKIKFATTPMKYQNDYGSFAGFLGSVGNSGYIILEFLLTKSDVPYSWSFYETLGGKPDYTVDIQGLNIVQVVNNIVENLSEDGIVDIEPTQLSASDNREIKFKVLDERRPPIGSVEDWIPVIEKWVAQEPKVLDLLQKESLPKVYSENFMKWVKDKPRYAELKYYLFSKVVKRFLLQRGLTNKTLKPRKKGSKARYIEDPVMNAQMQDVVESMSWRKKFDKLEKYIKGLVNNMVQSIYLYGTPGSGKSKTVIDTLDSENVDYKVYKGGVKGTDELVQILYNNRDNTIMVFDDFDSVRRNKDQVNILKSALENAPVREITWATKAKRGFNFPPQFEFSSGVIFISNDPRLDSALASRSINLEISLNADQMIDKMNATLAEFMPEVSMNIKKKALDFASEVAGGVAGGIDYRILQSIIVAIQIDPDDWKSTAQLVLASLG